MTLQIFGFTPGEEPVAMLREVQLSRPSEDGQSNSRPSPASSTPSAHFGGALHGRFKIVNLEPKQHPVSIWFVITIADRAVMVLYPIWRYASARYPEIQIRGKPLVSAFVAVYLNSTSSS
jgi:hypothetical protein